MTVYFFVFFLHSVGAQTRPQKELLLCLQNIVRRLPRGIFLNLHSMSIKTPIEWTLEPTNFPNTSTKWNATFNSRTPKMLRPCQPLSSQYRRWSTRQKSLRSSRDELIDYPSKEEDRTPKNDRSSSSNEKYPSYQSYHFHTSCWKQIKSSNYHYLHSRKNITFNSDICRLLRRP